MYANVKAGLEELNNSFKKAVEDKTRCQRDLRYLISFDDLERILKAMQTPVDKQICDCEIQPCHLHNAVEEAKFTPDTVGNEHKFFIKSVKKEECEHEFITPIGQETRCKKCGINFLCCHEYHFLMKKDKSPLEKKECNHNWERGVCIKCGAKVSVPKQDQTLAERLSDKFLEEINKCKCTNDIFAIKLAEIATLHFQKEIEEARKKGQEEIRKGNAYTEGKKYGYEKAVAELKERFRHATIAVQPSADYLRNFEHELFGQEDNKKEK